jgi:hypothetical protein
MLMPLWLISITVIVILPVAAFIGWKSGRRTHFERGYDKTPPTSFPGEITLGATLGLLGLLVAFTFNFSLSRSEMRKDAQLQEALAIGTAFLRAEVLEEPGRSALRTALASYAETRLTNQSIIRRDGLELFLARTLAAQAELWPTMQAAFREDTSPALRVLVINGMTDVLDAHTRRVAAGRDYVPQFPKLMLFSAAVAAMFFVGNNSGLRGRSLSWRTFFFAIVMASLIIVILDFERSQEGFIQIDTTIMRATIDDIRAQLANRK